MNTDRFSTYIVEGNHQCFMYIDIKGLLGYQSYPLTVYIVIQTEYRVCDMSKMSEMSF